ncbi:MAG: hypothetical protein RSF67_01705 [Clostridia bacterium]
MIDKINSEIEKIANEIKDDVEWKQTKNGCLTMLTLDNIVEKYCSNSMFDSGLEDIFSGNYPDENEKGSYVYYVKEKLIEQEVGIDIYDEGIDPDDISNVIITFDLINKNNIEVEDRKSYDYYDYCKWNVVVSDISVH